MNPARITLALLLLCTAPVFAKAPTQLIYLTPGSVNVETLLPPPPTPGSPANNADIRAVLAHQHSRNAIQVLRARSEVNLSPAAFDDVLGPWFTAANLPHTFTLLNNASHDSEAISQSAKNLWNRPRPPYQDLNVNPVVQVPTTPSYPSGHSTRAALWASILSELAPDAKQTLLARGAQIGQDRVIAGVHFPSDVAAGQLLGHTIAARLLATPKFQHDLAIARPEFNAARPTTAVMLPIFTFHHFSATQ